MVKNKIVAAGLAGVLAMPFGLAACGNNASSSAAASTSAAATSAASATSASEITASNEVLYWEGKLSDGRTVDYLEDGRGQHALLYIGNEDGTEGTTWIGNLTSANGKQVITDEETKASISFTPVSITEDLSTMKLDIEGYGEVDLKATTKDQFAQAAAQAITTAVVYWEGALPDGQTVSYMEDIEGKSGTLGIAAADGSGEQSWTGPFAIADDKITINDEKGKGSISFSETRGTDSASLKLNIDGYGEVSMKPVTAEEFAKRLGQAISETVLYWEGTLADGSSVGYIDNSENKEGTLMITKADLSDAKYWSGALVEEGEKVTITDADSKQAVSFTFVGDPNSTTAIKIDIEGYGQVDMKPVTAGDFGEALGQLLASEQK